jgi:hypothetical protein
VPRRSRVLQVIRLHFQQYKLQEAHRELKAQQRARLELQDQVDGLEREFAAENEATAKRSKEVIEKILAMAGPNRPIGRP